MNLIPERLIKVREELGISKAEAARRLNMSAMGYGRYENGDRKPSYQTLAFMAQKLETSMEFLCGETNDINYTDYIVTTETPELYQIVEILKKENKENLNRVFEYIKSIQ